MTVTIVTKGHTYIIDDPEELTIEVSKGIVFDAAREDGVQIFKYKEEHNEQRDNGTGQP